jgi:uncharacterized protein (TIGR02452 family)
MDRKALAEETRLIVEQGYYVNPAGVRTSISAFVENARKGTKLYRPEEIQALVDQPVVPAGKPMKLEVTAESTSEAAIRLIRNYGVLDVAALNFASAKNPGGGWLGGARAQEEDLAISSGLVTCLWKTPEYYLANNMETSLLYTDHLIHTPDVPFFRDEQKALMENPVLVSIITSPAPNAGEYLRSHPNDLDGVRVALNRRAGHVLAAAKAHKHRTLVLGAWGCGVFRNMPEDVAMSFKTWLADPRFVGAFSRVVFAILDRSETKATLAAFQKVFATVPAPPA